MKSSFSVRLELSGALLVAALLLGVGCSQPSGGLYSGDASESRLARPGEIDVSLTISEPAGIERKHAPVTVGVPMALGCLEDAGKLRVLGPDGGEVPSQIRILNRWLPRSSSAQWVLVDFQADVPARGKVVYRLTNDRPASPAWTPLVAKKKRDVVTVSTGPLKFVVKGKGFNLFDKVWLDLDGNGKFTDDELIVQPSSGNGIVLTDASQRKHISFASAATVELEEVGALRVVVKVTGKLLDMEAGTQLSHITRLFAYVNRSDVRVQHLLRNAPPGNFAPKPVNFAGLSLATRLNLSGVPSFAFGADKKDVSGKLVTRDELCLYQDSPGGEFWDSRSGGGPRNTLVPGFPGWRLYGAGGKKVAQGDFAEGWVDVSCGKFGVTAGVRYLWQQYPKSLTVRGDGTVSIELWPTRYAPGHTIQSDGQKGHEVVFAFHAGGAEGTGERFTRFHRYLVATPALAWVQKTRAWPDFGDLIARPELALLDVKQAEQRRAENGLFGWPHFGGYRGEFGGGSYEPPSWRGQLYLESGGDRGRYDIFEQNAWHWRDRDGFHVDGIDIEELARQDPNGPQEFYGNRQKKRGRGVWPHMDFEHIGTNEEVHYYLLTGDPAMGDVLVEEVAWPKVFLWGRVKEWIERVRAAGDGSITDFEKDDWRIKAETRGTSWPYARTVGWQLRTYVNCYRALNRPKDLAYAAYVVKRSMRNQDLMCGLYAGERADKSKTDLRRNPRDKPWMEAIVAAGIFSYYEVTRDEEVLDSLYGFCRWLADKRVTGPAGAPYIWNFVEQNLDREGCASSQRNPGTLALGFRYTGEKSFLDAAQRQVVGLGWKKNHINDGAVNAPVYWAEIAHLKDRDVVAPAAVTDLSLRALGGGRVEVQFTAPGDDGSVGRASRYQVKFAYKAMVERIPFFERMRSWDPQTFMDADQVNFWAAYNAKDEPAPAPAGSEERFVLTGIKAGTTWFALKVWDDGPNMSAISNLVKVEVK